MESTGVAFVAGCFNGTVVHVVTGRAHFTQRRIGWVVRVGVRIVGTIGGRVHAFCGDKHVAGGRSAISVDVQRGRVLAVGAETAGLVVGRCPNDITRAHPITLPIIARGRKWVVDDQM